MGAWGTGHFDNDDACDFAGELGESPSWDRVRQALNGAIASDYLEAPDASNALAAAAIVAAARSGSADALPEDFQALPRALGALPQDLTSVALKAVQRVATNSELAELWAESDDNNEWRAELAALEAGLK
jgi:hypothetical protein